MALVEKEDISDLLSVSALIEPEMTRLDSILGVVEMLLDATTRDRVWLSDRNAVLLKLIAAQAPAIKLDKEVRKNLAAGRIKGAAANHEVAAELKKIHRKGAVDYFVANLGDTVDDYIRFLGTSIGMAERTFKDLISGCKKEAAQKVREKRANMVRPEVSR